MAENLALLSIIQIIPPRSWEGMTVMYADKVCTIKEIPGSHVIVKTNGQELPDQTFEEAGRLAAYYSKGRDTKKVEIDYTEKKALNNAQREFELTEKEKDIILKHMWPLTVIPPRSWEGMTVMT